MEYKHRQVLLQCREKLLADISSPLALLDNLVANGILPVNEDYRSIFHLSSDAEKTRAFLDLLPKLGPKAYSCFKQTLQTNRHHLAKLLEQREAEETVDGGGKFPPTSPSLTAVQRVQESLRTHYRALGRQTGVLDYDCSAPPTGLNDVYVAVSSLELDEVQEMRRRRNSERRNESKPADRNRSDCKAMASGRGEAMELPLRRLLRFANGKRANSCMVVGPGGVGKTLLLEWLMVSWAEGRLEELSEFELVIRLNRRDATALASKTAIGVFEGALRRQCGVDGAELKEIVEHFRVNSRPLLLLVDSPEEGGEAWSKNDGLQMLVEKRSLERCSVIITSRPCSLAYNLARWCQLRYYAVGFSDKQLYDLLERILGEFKAKRVEELLKEEPRGQLRELMKTTPLLASMVASLAKDSEGDLPSTMTQTYHAMCTDMIERQKHKRLDAAGCHQQTASCFDASRSDVLETFGNMALAGLTQKSFVFDVDKEKRQLLKRRSILLDIDKANARSVDLACEFDIGRQIGFFVEYKHLKAGQCNSHFMEFVHSSWQEYFAAYALVQQMPPQLGEEDFQCLVEKLGIGEEMELFWRFVAGHAQEEHLLTLMKALRKTYCRQGQSWTTSRWPLFACSCLAEAIPHPMDSNQPVSSIDKVHYVKEVARQVLPSAMDLSDTMMGVADVKTLSIALEHAPDVSLLDMRYCRLREEHARALGRAMTHVQGAILYGNEGLHGPGLDALAQSLARCHNLSQLNLGKCGMDASDCNALSSLLGPLKSLRKLDMYYNRLDSDGLESLEKPLAESGLESVSFIKNDLDHDSGRVLGDVIEKSNDLQELLVCDNELGNRGVQQIMGGVEKSLRLRLLDLSHTGVNDSVLVSVLAALTHRSEKAARPDPPCSLTIRLHGNAISEKELERLANELPTSCKDRIECNSTWIEHGTHGKRSYKEFFEEYQRNGSEDDLQLGRHGVDDCSANEISSLLTSECYYVQALYLGGNSVGDVGAVALANALCSNTSLKGLSLSWNKIGVVGFSELVKSLTVSNNSLLFLDMYANPMFPEPSSVDGEKAQRSLHSVVSNCKSLRRIGLGKTGLGDEGCKTIEKSWSEQCDGSLIMLDVRDNSITDNGVVALCRGVEKNSKVTFVELSGNKITSKGAEAIQLCVQSRLAQQSPMERVWLAGNEVDEEQMTARSMVKARLGWPSITHFISKYLQ